MGYTPSASTYTTGTLTALDGVVGLTVPSGHSSWTVYVSGTFPSTSAISFEGSPDNSVWHALNGRRNTDAASNDTTTFVDANPVGGASPLGGNPSNWRGNIAAIRYFRVRLSTFTSGDSVAIKIVTADGYGATFQNAALPSGTNLIGAVNTQFYFQTNLGRSYGGTTDILTLTAAPTGANLLVLYNPSANTKSLYVYRININGNFGNNGIGMFIRKRFTTATTPTLGTAITPISRNTSAVASIASLRAGSVSIGVLTGVTIGGSPVFYTEKAIILTTGAVDASNEDGSLILPPGTGITIQYTTVAAATTVAAEVVWHEI